MERDFEFEALIQSKLDALHTVPYGIPPDIAIVSQFIAAIQQEYTRLLLTNPQEQYVLPLNQKSGALVFNLDFVFICKSDISFLIRLHFPRRCKYIGKWPAIRSTLITLTKAMEQQHRRQRL
jgi:hypothetical protein